MASGSEKNAIESVRGIDRDGSNMEDVDDTL
jgi:hypothetical protein